MGASRLKILTEARLILEKENDSPHDRDSVVKLLNILILALEKHALDDDEVSQNIARQLVDNNSLLALLKQQTDELDALKKLSINLTSSLDLPDVLDAVVSEAMRLIENTRDVNIFLYKNHKL